MKRVVTGCATPGSALLGFLRHRVLGSIGTLGITFLLSGCATVRYVDKPRVVTVSVPVVQKLDPAFLADCQPEPLQGTTVEAALARLASSDTCLSTLRGQLDKLRALQNAPAAAL